MKSGEQASLLRKKINPLIVENKSKGKFVHQKIVAWSLQNQKI